MSASRRKSAGEKRAAGSKRKGSATVRGGKKNAPEQALSEGSVKLEDVFVRKLQYNELDAKSFPNAASSENDVRVQGSIKPRYQDFLEIELMVTVAPYRRDAAFELTVTMSANFRREGNVSVDRFAQFVAKRSGSMVMPYVRELVSSVTGRGIHQTYYMEPLILEPKVDDESLEHLIRIIETLPATAEQ